MTRADGDAEGRVMPRCCLSGLELSPPLSEAQARTVPMHFETSFVQRHAENHLARTPRLVEWREMVMA